MAIDFNSIYEGMSTAEIAVANFLKEKRIYWSYEQPMYVIDNKNRPRVWTPDFYIPQLGIYIEAVGYEKVIDEFKKQTYFENNIPVIFVHVYKEEKKWQSYLLNEIIKLHEKRGNLIKSLS